MRSLIRVAKDQKVSDTILDKENQGGVSRFANQVHWARFYLAEAGFIDRSQHGVWRLIEKARNIPPFSESEIRALVEAVQSTGATGRARPTPATSGGRTRPQASASAQENLPPAPEDDDTDHRTRLIAILKSLSPQGFERLCQRLLREAGFEQVTVTGRSGDGGIDGHGVLGLNAFVSFRVLFQCKRYQGSVTPGEVRDFRGALQGRADKGIILTTGSFTADARREAFATAPRLLSW